MSRLGSTVVAITGASAGIGRATALRVAEEGGRVALSARRGERLDAAVADITSRGGQAIAVPGDVTQDADMHTLVARCVDAFGRLDVMVCNAGIGYHGPLTETTPEAMHQLLDVNVLGTMLAARAALAQMQRQGHGHIIAISSISGRRGVGGSSLYSATKAAQIGFIEALRAEFVGTAFHASIVYPVATTTEFHDAIAHNFGFQVRGHGPTQSAEHVARAIADCIVSPRAEVYPYRLARWLAVLSVLAPRQADRVIKKFGRRRTAPGAHDQDGRPHS